MCKRFIIWQEILVKLKIPVHNKTLYLFCKYDLKWNVILIIWNKNWNWLFAVLITAHVSFARLSEYVWIRSSKSVNEKQSEFLSLIASQLMFKILDRLQYWMNYQDWRTLCNFNTNDFIVCKQNINPELLYTESRKLDSEIAVLRFTYIALLKQTWQERSVHDLKNQYNSWYEGNVLHFERKSHSRKKHYGDCSHTRNYHDQSICKCKKKKKNRSSTNDEWNTQFSNLRQIKQK